MSDEVDGLRDDQWEGVKGFVPGGTKGKRGPRPDNRRFLDALLWMARSGGGWKDLPERLGDYRTVKRPTTIGSHAACWIRRWRTWPAKPI